MNRLCIAAIVALFSQLPAHSQGFLMWQAQKEDRVIHVLANVPFLSEDMLPNLAKEIQDAYTASAVMVFESDPDPERRRAGMQQIIESALYPEGDNLFNHLPPPVKKQFQRATKNMTLSNETLGRLKPWMAAQNLLRIASVHAKVRLADDMERYFYRRAVSDDKPLAFLNTANETIDLYGNMPEEQQIRLFEKAMRDMQTMTNTLAELETAWRNSNVDQASQIIARSFDGFEDVHARLFAGRNTDWASDLDAQSGIEGEIMALVSLSHLVGVDNLLEQLKARGYLIAQVVRE